MSIETTENVRLIKNHAEEGHFCQCGEPATNSCTDARQTVTSAGGFQVTTWEEDTPRYGCDLHRVESMIYFSDGTSLMAREYEKNADRS